jgi:hypothetical protein
MLRTKALLLALSLALFGVGCAASDEEAASGGAAAQTAEEALSLENWENHPKLQEINDLRTEAETAIRDGRWPFQIKDNLCEDAGEDYRIKVTDEAGRIRSIAVTAGGDDSYSELETIYDAAGKLRFVKSTFNTVRGTGEDHLVFLDTDGNFVWEVIREYTPGEDGEGVPGDWRLPRSAEEDPFDSFAFEDPNFLDAPELVFEREPICR